MKEMFVYKFDVIEELREAGYSQSRILTEKLIGAKSLTDIRNGRMVGIHTLETLCKLLDMQPGNIIKYVDDYK